MQQCKMCTSLALKITAFLILTSAASAFNVTIGDPTECDNFQISWTGGQAPFELGLYPLFGSQRFTTIPDSAFSNGQGSYSTQLTIAQGHRFLVVMSDATGFATGGVSQLYTVGSSKGGNCNVTDPGVNFFWDATGALTQCRSYPVEGWQDTGAQFPVTILGLVPDGTFFKNTVSKGNSFTISAVNIKAGTDVVFSVTDAQNRTGGVADLTTVGQSDVTNCLTSIAASSTAVPTSTSTSAADSSATPDTSVSAGTIGAIAAGGLVASASLVALVLFLLRRGRRPSRRMDFDDHQDTSTGFPPGRYDPQPYTLQTPPPFEMQSIDSSTDLIGPPSIPSRDATNGYSRPSSGVTTSGKGSLRTQPRRYIMHTDAADAEPTLEEEEVVELPPQYSESRGPIPGLAPPHELATEPSSSHTHYS
ncbi:hypothetical protein OF83DRAFT_1098363 [Amylostereum chailletii]|nr:hypothetical protein OF83DRAFT_1098363 [Amylostereum chailletii]